MRHFDAWILRDPYSIFHYYSTGRRWQETIRDLIKQRKICAPSIDLSPASAPVDPYLRPIADQSDCMFLSKLPLEIRLMIYEYAFGDSVVHLVQVKDKIRHVRCQHTVSSLDGNRRCCPPTLARWRLQQDPPSAPTFSSHHGPKTDSMLYPHTHPSLPSSLSNTPLSLLRACRTIYAEAASILYSNVAFDVDDLHTFIAFSLTISPHSLNSIKRLTVQWQPIWQPMSGEEHKSSIYSHTHNDHLWSLFWTRVAALNGLQELRLSLDLGRFSGSPLTGLIGGKRLHLSVHEPWVAPLLAVRGLQDFELGITVRCDAYAKSILETELLRDAVTLRDHLKAAMCSSRKGTQGEDGHHHHDDAGIPFALPHGVELSQQQLLQLRQLLLLKRACDDADAREWESSLTELRRLRPRLAITAA